MLSVKNFFSEQEQTLLLNAIEEAEKHTSGEIRLHLDNYCFGNELNAAKRVFARLNMQHTKQRNGVLIYIAVKSRKIALFADEGIYKVLGQEYWNNLVEQLIKQFRADNRASSLAECILECGKQLGKHFPLLDDDKNELSNAISY